jgi:hypothetical protein
MMFFNWKFRHACGIRSRRSLLQSIALLFATFAVFIFNHTGAGATESLLSHEKPWIGDFDGMLERRKIRVLVPYSKTFLLPATNRGHGSSMWSLSATCKTRNG